MRGTALGWYDWIPLSSLFIYQPFLVLLVSFSHSRVICYSSFHKIFFSFSLFFTRFSFYFLPPSFFLDLFIVPCIFSIFYSFLLFSLFLSYFLISFFILSFLPLLFYSLQFSLNMFYFSFFLSFFLTYFAVSFVIFAIPSFLSLFSPTFFEYFFLYFIISSIITLFSPTFFKYFFVFSFFLFSFFLSFFFLSFFFLSNFVIVVNIFLLLFLFVFHFSFLSFSLFILTSQFRSSFQHSVFNSSSIALYIFLYMIFLVILFSLLLPFFFAPSFLLSFFFSFFLTSQFNFSFYHYLLYCFLVFLSLIFFPLIFFLFVDMFTDPFYHTFIFLFYPSSFVFFFFFFLLILLALLHQISFFLSSHSHSHSQLMYAIYNRIKFLSLFSKTIDYSSLSNYPSRQTLITSSSSSSLFLSRTLPLSDLLSTSLKQTGPSLIFLLQFSSIISNAAFHFIPNHPFLRRQHSPPSENFIASVPVKRFLFTFPSNISPVPSPPLRSLFLCQFCLFFSQINNVFFVHFLPNFLFHSFSLDAFLAFFLSLPSLSLSLSLVNFSLLTSPFPKFVGFSSFTSTSLPSSSFVVVVVVVVVLLLLLLLLLHSLSLSACSPRTGGMEESNDNVVANSLIPR
ncbi:unnamed protein product [Acanthosepion pharaonis]|uniref:Uncharacterized protein n=1 Tax=Acanthosepion pharaonis TaxID=158019 RepID=A0A812BIL1_ACAPH|nr:unnamed protein product [Sepia pharaonis]